MHIMLIVVLVLLWGRGGWYYGYRGWGAIGGAGIGLGAAGVILLQCYLFGII
jgi:hypothetical protein